MATISYKCDTCKRSVELVENPQGFTVVGKCVITNGCIGRLYRTERNPNNVRESAPSYVEGLDNYIPRRAFYQFTQTLTSDRWTVEHDMGVLPSTFVYLLNDLNEYTLLDNSDYTVVSIDKNTIQITFPDRVKGLVQCVAKSTVPLVPPTIVPDTAQYQVTANNLITFAIPKYLTQIHGVIPEPTQPSITPTITPSPTPSSTPISLPKNLCFEGTTIQIEVEVTRPNEEPMLCFEEVTNVLDNRSPWFGWNEVLVRNRRNYCVRSLDIQKMKVFGSSTEIPEGTRIRFLRIDYGTGRKEAIPSRGLLMLLAKSPYAYVDKIKNRLVDVGELIGSTPDFFVYRNGELFLDENMLEQSYPDISRVIYQSAPPIPSPTPTPTVTATITPTPTSSLTPTPSPTITATPTPFPSGTPAPSATETPYPTATPTPTVTATVTPSITPSETATPTPTVTATVTPSITPSETVTPTPTPTPSLSPSIEPTPSVTPSVTISPTISPTVTISPTPTPTPSLSFSVTDPFFDNVVLLLNGQTLNDTSSHARVPTDTTGVSLVADSPFGGGYTSYRNTAQFNTFLEFASSADFELRQEYTFEFWYKADNAGGFMMANNATRHMAKFDTTGIYTTAWGDPSFSLTTYGMGTWIAVAISRDAAGNIYTFRNGVLDTMTTGSLDTSPGATLFGIFGVPGRGDLESFRGNFASIRYTQDVCRYTSNYTVATAPFPES